MLLLWLGLRPTLYGTAFPLLVTIQPHSANLNDILLSALQIVVWLLTYSLTSPVCRRWPIVAPFLSQYPLPVSLIIWSNLCRTAVGTGSLLGMPHLMETCASIACYCYWLQERFSTTSLSLQWRVLESCWCCTAPNIQLFKYVALSYMLSCN